ncbi:MAG: glycoside hydrolase family 2 [Ruminococcaceae bacterium]|nr:glycoside hydrolase family 2 [Oscillospiraceae bacterium]
MPIALLTKQGEALLASNETPWQVYPRPQMKRDSYLNLNGWWEFSAGNAEVSRKIRVPFCPESQLSGINQHFPEGVPLIYRRNFTLPEGFRKDRVLLHIGGADQIAEITLNGQLIGRHEGGYEAFCFDITFALQEENCLEITCTDDLRDKSLPYGKQVMKRGGMWYTPVSGIWQTVWLESVPDRYIRRLHIDTKDAAVTISTEPFLPGTVTVPGLGAFPLGSTITLENPHFWSPEDPYLYEFAVETETDRVESYFALRTLDVREIHGIPQLCLNGKPYFFHGLLDQGYWPDGLFTPAHPDCYAEDILAMKKLGFNTLRKHIKVEPEEFYYQCDRLGMVVFQDMVNNGKYSFFRDTVLPTIGLQKLPDRGLHRDPQTRKRFLNAMAATVKQLKNHPCICYWTIFNEGWGQFDSDNVYRQMRKLDNTRFIDSTSGWFRRKKTDVDSRHVYFKKVKLTATDKPLVLSEFGGYSYKPEGHVFNTEQTYGYGKFENAEEFAQAVERLYKDEILPARGQGLCAAIYTQVSDVEDETNGLLSYDRKVCKLDAKRMSAIAELLK